MVDRKNIETGVDKLVVLVNDKKKISVNKAADELGVSIPVIQEWADFLEDEGLISIEYKLSRTYLCERQLSKTEVEKKARVYSSKKDAFTRKVEGALHSLQKESSGLEAIKKEFEKLKDGIGSDIDQVREELQELRHYETLKKNIDKDIIQQKLDYQEMMENVRRQVAEQRKKYEGYVDKVSLDRSKIEEGKVELGYLENKFNNLSTRIDALKEILKSLEGKINLQKTEITKAVEKTKSDVEYANKLRKDLLFRIDQELKPLLTKSKENEQKIIAVQDSILKKVKKTKQDIDKYQMQSTKAADGFRAFFDRKVKTQKLIESLEKDKIELEKSLQELIKKAASFNLSLKSSTVKKYVKELETSLKKIETKKNTFKSGLETLTDLISGK